MDRELERALEILQARGQIHEFEIHEHMYHFQSKYSHCFLLFCISFFIILFCFSVRTTPGGPWRAVQHSSDFSEAEREALLPFRFSHPLLLDIATGGDNVPIVLDAVIPEVVNLTLAGEGAVEGGNQDEEDEPEGDGGDGGLD